MTVLKEVEHGVKSKVKGPYCGNQFIPHPLQTTCLLTAVPQSYRGVGKKKCTHRNCLDSIGKQNFGGEIQGISEIQYTHYPVTEIQYTHYPVPHRPSEMVRALLQA